MEFPVDTSDVVLDPDELPPSQRPQTTSNLFQDKGLEVAFEQQNKKALDEVENTTPEQREKRRKAAEEWQRKQKEAEEFKKYMEERDQRIKEEEEEEAAILIDEPTQPSETAEEREARIKKEKDEKAEKIRIMARNKPQAEFAKASGTAAFKDGKFEEAMKLYSKAIRHFPYDITYYTNRAACFFMMHKFKECITDCRDGVNIGRKHNGSYENIAKYFDKFMRFLQTRAFARAGRAYLAMENYQMAVQSFTQSLTEWRTAEVEKQLKEAEKKLEKWEEYEKKLLQPPSFDEFKQDVTVATAKLMFLYVMRQCEYRLPRKMFNNLIKKDRTTCYQKAIQSTIESLKSQNVQEIDVLTLGGTGLTSMIAHSCGVSSVTNIEKWHTVSELVQKVYSDNFKTEIRCLTREPNDLVIDFGDNDLKTSADVLIWDCDHTLLSRGILETLLHCRKEQLITKKAKIIPAAARIFAQVIFVHVPTAEDLNLRPMDIYLWNVGPGGCQTVDMGDLVFQPITAPFEIFDFDFHSTNFAAEAKTVEIPTIINKDAFANAIVYWWDVDMTPQNSNSPQRIQFSTGPKQPHAKQLIQYLPIMKVTQDDSKLTIDVKHDKKHFQFNVRKAATETPLWDANDDPRPTISFEYFSKAHQKKVELYRNAIESFITKGISVLDVGAGTAQFGMIAKKFGAGNVTCCDVMPHLAPIARRMIAMNGFDKKIEYITKNVKHLEISTTAQKGDLPSKCSLIISDIGHPFRFLGKEIAELITLAKMKYGVPSACLIPSSVVLKAQAISVNAQPIAGFNYGNFHNSSFCELYEGGAPGINLDENNWEPLCRPFTAVSFDFRQPPMQPEQEERHLKINKHGIFNAMIYWYELALGSDDVVLSTKPGCGINWQQGIQEYDFDIPLREDVILPVKCGTDFQNVVFEVNLSAHELYKSQPRSYQTSQGMKIAREQLTKLEELVREVVNKKLTSVEKMISILKSMMLAVEESESGESNAQLIDFFPEEKLRRRVRFFDPEVIAELIKFAYQRVVYW